MRAVRSFLVILLLSIPLCAPAFGYGREGHQAIAEIAGRMLQPRARQAVQRILGSDDLAKVSTWADDLKQAKRHQGPLSGDAEALRFNIRFPDNGNWHFVNLPLGTGAYEDTGRFSDPHDIVHQIDECVRALESPRGGGSQPPKRLSPSEALRLLIHLVGDIHQPLHVGTGYYDLSGPVPVLVVDPARVSGLPDDAGANDLRYGNGRFSELHAYWDDSLVEKVARTKSYLKLARALEPRIRPRLWSTPGDYHRWAEAWATDSVHQARAAYRGIVFLAAERTPKGKLKLIRIRLPRSYDREQRARAADQLAKAGFHLGALLNRIRWATDVKR